MNIPVTAQIPDLWGNQVFAKSEWGGINYLVGPNGSGKTRFADHLRGGLSNAGLKPRYLSAERLAGLEKRDYWGFGGAFNQGFNVVNYLHYRNVGTQQGLSADAFIILKEKLNVRIRIEAFLAGIFGRRIRFAEEGGFLRPKIQRMRGGGEYEMKESECHGLKELITILAFLYDDEFDALIIDEPELHLHPQFQGFLLAEIRRVAGDPRVDTSAKIFFLITHSPYLLDFRTLEDLRNCVVFHATEIPSFIGDLTSQDEIFLKRLLPRLNTHHKQFFFANRPIFVEGYTDQQLFTLVQESRGKLLGATGACFIDVNGKYEQDFYFRLCRHLRINAQFIVDLDLITRGNLRKSVSEHDKCKSYVSEQGIGPDLMDSIRELNVGLDSLCRTVESSFEAGIADVKASIHLAKDTEAKRYNMLMASIHHREKIVGVLHENASEVDYVVAKAKRISEAAREAGVFLLPKGAFENHLESYKGSIYQVSENAKATVFETERDFILGDPGQSEIEKRYGDLIPLLDAASGACEVNLKLHLGYAVGIFIGNVQIAFQRGEIDSEDSLKIHSSIDWKTYGRIFNVVSFAAKNGEFVCKMRLKRNVDTTETEFEFTDATPHSKFYFPTTDHTLSIGKNVTTQSIG